MSSLFLHFILALWFITRYSFDPSYILLLIYHAHNSLSFDWWNMHHVSSIILSCVYSSVATMLSNSILEPKMDNYWMLGSVVFRLESFLAHLSKWSNVVLGRGEVCPQSTWNHRCCLKCCQYNFRVLDGQVSLYVLYLFWTKFHALAHNITTCIGEIWLVHFNLLSVHLV